MRKVLVTGGCGFVGSVLIRELLSQGVETTALDLPRAQERFAFKGQARFIGTDLSDLDALRFALTEHYDVVFHTAALFKYGVPREIIRQVNVEGTRNLCRAMLERGITRLINWGSSTVYGFWDDPKLIKDETWALDEKDLVETYCWSKREQEKAAAEFIRQGLEVTTIRPGDIYGPGTAMGLALPLYMFKIGLLRSVPGFQESFISHVHVEDVARAAIHLARLPQAAGQIYNIADCHPASNIDTIEMVAKILKTWRMPTRRETWGIPIFHTPTFILKISGLIEECRAKLAGTYPKFDRYSAVMPVKNHILSNAKLLATGFKFKWPDFRQALPSVIAWYEANQWAPLKS